VKSSQKGGGLVEVKAVNNEGELGDSGGSEGRCNGVSLLGLVNLLVPLSPGLKWGEHATLTAHVTEGTLA
jgi:hypothetical protein